MRVQVVDSENEAWLVTWVVVDVAVIVYMNCYLIVCSGSKVYREVKHCYPYAKKVRRVVDRPCLSLSCGFRLDDILDVLTSLDGASP